jgi:hypothetical protein
MNKEFIPYEQALALKELGFDAQCFAHYRDKESLVACNQGIYGISYSDIEAPTKVILAPLYQQAFRWFREEYTLYHDIKMFGDWDNPQFSYIVSGRTITNPAHMWHYESKYSYEEAEFECIKKLIEIVKK